MNDKSKPKAQLISELAQLREKVAELESTEGKYRTLFQNLPVGIFQSTPAGRYRLVNPAFAHMVGFESPEKMLNEVKDISTLYADPADREEVKRLFATQGQLNGHIIRHKRKDGQMRWMAIYAKANYDNSGKIIYYDGFTLDVTERKRAEEALRESETRFATIFHASPTAIALTRLRDNQLIDVNQAWLDLTGYHKEEVIGKRVQDLNLWVNPENRAQLIKALGERGPVEKFEFQMRRKSGEAVDLLFSAEVIVLAGGAHMLSMAMDISERKQAEEMLKLSQAALNKAQQTAHLGSWTWHIQSNQLEWSDEMYRIFGIDQETFVGDLSDVISRAIHPDDRAKVEQSNLSVINDGRPQPLEYRVIWPDGSIRMIWAEAGELILDQAGNPAFLTGIAQDVTERKMYREVLRESTERFKAIFFQSPIAIELFDANGLLVEANPKCLELFGVSDIQHVKGFKLFDDPNIPITEIEKLKKGQQISFTSEFDFEVVKKQNLYPTSRSGKMFWDVFVKALLDENGSISGYLVQVQDTTERKQTEEALLENQKRYEKAQTMGHVGNWEYDPVTTNFWGSDEAKRIYGFKLNAKDFTTDDVENCIPERERVHQALIDLIEHDKKYDLEFDIITRDKGLRKTIHSIAEVERDVQGNPLKITGVISDITERKQAEQTQKQLNRQLEQQTHQLQMVMDSVPEGVIVINANGRILLANPTSRNHLSVLAGGFEVGDKVQQLGEYPLEALLTHPPEGLWHQISWQNRSFELIAKPLKGSGEAEGWVIVIRDITIAKEIQERIQQQERLASVGQLAAGIAHDFNNIMAVISLYADLSLKDPRLPPDVVRRFNTIKKQSGHAIDLIQQILDFSRRSVMERLPMDLIPFLKEMRKLFERTLPEAIDFRLSYTENTFVIHGDPTRLQQVIMNLVVNARDAMPDGGMIQIDLERIKPDKFGTGMLDLARTLKQNGQPPDWVRLTIQDTGTGIPAAVLPHIFEPFYTTKEPGKGTGLGLAQVFGIIEQHDGRIDVLTEVGKGSTFIITLPLLEANGSTNEMTTIENLPYGHGETILVVEDNLEIQQVMRVSLEELNYSPQIASNGLEALDILVKRGNEIALVLTDLIMPKMGGKMLVQTMHQKGITTKVIIMTGHPMGDEKKTIMALGVFDWLDKPPRLEKLAQVVARALEKA